MIIMHRHKISGLHLSNAFPYRINIWKRYVVQRSGEECLEAARKVAQERGAFGGSPFLKGTHPIIPDHQAIGDAWCFSKRSSDSKAARFVLDSTQIVADLYNVGIMRGE